MPGGIEFPIVTHECRNIARQGKFLDPGAPHPVIDHFRSAHCGQQCVGGRIRTARDHELDQLVRRKRVPRLYRRARTRKGRRTLRHHQRPFLLESPAALVHAFEIGCRDRDFAGAGHREALVAQYRNLMPGRKIQRGNPDAAFRAIGKLRDLPLEIRIIPRNIARWIAKLGAERAVEACLEIFARLRRGDRSGKSQCAQCDPEQTAFHDPNPIKNILCERLTGSPCCSMKRATKRAEMTDETSRSPSKAAENSNFSPI